MKIKNLRWVTKPADGEYSTTTLCADPEGLRWAYRISYPENNNDKFELVLIDSDGRWDDKLTTFHNTIELAQECADAHYKSIISHHIVSVH